MTTETFKITSYEAKSAHVIQTTEQSKPVTFPSCILCRGKGFLVIVYLLDNMISAPANTFLPEHKCGTLFITRQRYDMLLQRLKSKEPVFFHLNSVSPEKNRFVFNKSHNDNTPQPIPPPVAPSYAHYPLTESYELRESPRYGCY